MATEGGSPAKGKKAGKRSHPTTAGIETSRVLKQAASEVEDPALGSPVVKKRRSAATAAIAAVAAAVASEQKEPKSSTHGSQNKSGRGGAAKNQALQANKGANKQSVTSPSVQGSPQQSNQKNDTVKGEEWSTEDLAKLIENLISLLPKSDSVKYSTQVDRMDWNKVSFATHTAEECKDKWNTIMTKLRRYRTLTELVLDAKEWVKHPWMTYNNSKGKPKHPDLPKKPLTPYFRYFLEKREKYSQDNPEMSMTELAKLLAKKFAELPEKKKQKYKESYEKENETYKRQMEKFKEEHPDMYPDIEVKSRPQNKQNGPHKPQTPIQLFLAEKMNKHLDGSGSNRKELEEKYRAQWKNLKDSKRVSWIKKAMADEQRFETELAEYCLLHPEFKPDQVKSVISKAEKTIKDRSEGKPERPPNSGYSLYSKIMLKELKDIPSKEKMSEISRRWKELSEKERQSYARQATEAMEQYQHDYKQYVSKLSEEERKKLEEEGKKKKKPANSQAASAAASQMSKQNAANESIDSIPSRPKKPLSALFLYQQEKLAQYKSKHPDKSDQELLRLIAREYGELSEKKKEKYKKMAEEAKKTHEQTTSSKENEVKNKAFKGEPKKPPQSGYSLFTSELMSKLTEIEPKFRMAEISKRWGALTNAEKEKYKRRATDLQKKFSKELQKFLLTLTDEEKKVYQQMKAKKPIRRKTPAVKTAAAEESSSSSESSKEENKEESSSSESESGSDSGSSSESEESESESGSESDSDSKSEASGSGKDSEEDDNEKEDKDDSAESSSGESESQTDSGSASESESE